ncbi:hypothetical protein AVEN_104366-1 [Araneus ventricosus]|uniref:Uncharacterized protein n=1 Tax=Araneus ventricosus TaxID=182803 RepID=A0A4Y2M542_ARAVE|nr:hypothetical protein AVEN_104366-1 [Araneus ventricosus]
MGGSKPNSTEYPPCMWVRCTLNHTQEAKHYPAGVLRELGEGLPPQVPSFSSDRGSKLRDPSQNSSRHASKWDVNITKLTRGGQDLGNSVWDEAWFINSIPLKCSAIKMLKRNGQPIGRKWPSNFRHSLYTRKLSQLLKRE